MPNDAGRHLVAFGLGMRRFTCLNTSGNHSRQLPAAVRACKSQNIFILLLGELFGAVQKADLAAGKAFSVGQKGWKQFIRQVPYEKHPLPGSSLWPSSMGSQSPATTLAPSLLLQHYFWVSLIVSGDGFSTYVYLRVLIPLITHVLLGMRPPPCVPVAGGAGRAGWTACLCILPMLISSSSSLLTPWPAILPQALKKSQLEIGLHNKCS